MMTEPSGNMYPTMIQNIVVPREVFRDRDDKVPYCKYIYFPVHSTQDYFVVQRDVKEISFESRNYTKIG